jgi:hypothetical protein
VLGGRAADTPNLVLAGVVIALLPPITVFVLAQRYFVENVAAPDSRAERHPPTRPCGEQDATPRARPQIQLVNQIRSRQASYGSVCAASSG